MVTLPRSSRSSVSLLCITAKLTRSRRSGTSRGTKMCKSHKLINYSAWRLLRAASGSEIQVLVFGAVITKTNPPRARRRS